MKALLLTIVVCVGLLLAGCGSDDSSTDATGSAGATTESSESRTPSGDDAGDAGGQADAGKLTKPDVEPPSGPPPTDLVIEDIEEGSGPAAEKGDKVTVHFVADDQTGKERFTTWPDQQLVFELGSGRYSPAFEEGVEGMKAGGRRELDVPAKQAQYVNSPLFYVIDLVAIE